MGCFSIIILCCLHFPLRHKRLLSRPPGLQEGLLAYSHLGLSEYLWPISGLDTQIRPIRGHLWLYTGRMTDGWGHGTWRNKFTPAIFRGTDRHSSHRQLIQILLWLNEKMKTQVGRADFSSSNSSPQKLDNAMMPRGLPPARYMYQKNQTGQAFKNFDILFWIWDLTLNIPKNDILEELFSMNPLSLK